MSALIAHPVAAIPFARYGLCLSALIIGSMSPDFLYFFQISTNAQFGHTLPGLVLFCLPAGMVVFWLFHTVFKCPMFLLLPENHQARLMPFMRHADTFTLRRQTVLMMASLLVGACTHLVWDSCTHASGWTVQHAAMLRFPVLSTSQGTLRVYKILQHGGTIGGTLLLIVWYWRWFSQAPDNPVPPVFHLSNVTKILIVLSLTGFAAFLGIGYGLYKVPAIRDIESFSYFVIVSAKAGCAGGCLGMLAYSIGWHVINDRKHEQFRLERKCD